MSCKHHLRCHWCTTFLLLPCMLMEHTSSCKEGRQAVACHANTCDAKICHANTCDAKTCHANTCDAKTCHASASDASACHAKICHATASRCVTYLCVTCTFLCISLRKDMSRNRISCKHAIFIAYPLYVTCFMRHTTHASYSCETNNIITRMSYTDASYSCEIASDANRGFDVPAPRLSFVPPLDMTDLTQQRPPVHLAGCSSLPPHSLSLHAQCAHEGLAYTCEQGSRGQGTRHHDTQGSTPHQDAQAVRCHCLDEGLSQVCASTSHRLCLCKLKARGVASFVLFPVRLALPYLFFVFLNVFLFLLSLFFLTHLQVGKGQCD